jgi:hypothetical protein
MSDTNPWASLFRQANSISIPTTRIGAGVAAGAVRAHPSQRSVPLAVDDAFLATPAGAAGGTSTQATASADVAAELAEGSRELLAAAQQLSKLKTLYVVKD